MKNPKEKKYRNFGRCSCWCNLDGTYVYDCIRLAYWNSRGGTGTADCCSICNIRMVNRMESAYPEE